MEILIYIQYNRLLRHGVTLVGGYSSWASRLAESSKHGGIRGPRVWKFDSVKRLKTFYCNKEINFV